MQALDDLLAYGAVQTTVAQIDWQYLAATKFVRNPPRFSLLMGGGAIGAEHSPSREGWLAQLLAMPVQERVAFLEQHVRHQIGRVMGIAPAKLNLDQPLLSLGLDSLMAVELRNKIELEFGIEISPMHFVRGITTGQLLAMVRDHVEQLAAAGGSAPANQEQAAIPPAPSVVGNRLAAPEREELAAMIEELSDDEVDAILDNLSPQPTPTH